MIPVEDAERKQILALLDARALARQEKFFWAEQLEDEILALREQGCSVRTLAKALEVGSSTIQDWTNHARQRR